MRARELLGGSGTAREKRKKQEVELQRLLTQRTQQPIRIVREPRVVTRASLFSVYRANCNTLASYISSRTSRGVRRGRTPITSNSVRQNAALFPTKKLSGSCAISRTLSQRPRVASQGRSSQGRAVTRGKRAPGIRRRYRGSQQSHLIQAQIARCERVIRCDFGVPNH